MSGIASLIILQFEPQIRWQSPFKDEELYHDAVHVIRHNELVTLFSHRANMRDNFFYKKE